MPLFTYSAIDDLGHTVTGELEASNESALETLLRKQGQWLTRARERAGSARGRGNRRVPRRVLVEFFLQTSLQLKAGIPLFNALTFGLEDGGHPKFVEVQKNVLERVKSGASFSESMAAHPRTFPPHVINLIRAGEASGRLSETCNELRRYYEWVDRLVADIRQAMFYPSFVGIAAVAFFFLVFTFLIPRFAKVLFELNVPLPWLTRVLLDISKAFVAHGGLIGAGIVGVIVAWKVVPRYSTKVARAMDQMKLSLPIFGSLTHLIALSRVAQNLATLYRAGIPLLDALTLCRPLVGNRVVEEALETVQASVNAGRPMGEAMKTEPVFSALMVQMVAVGESTGSLGDSLQHVADYYNEIVPRKVKKLFALMEPLMIVGLIVAVGIVALAVFMPLANALTAK